ncbi:hypothetical protein F511_13199 [Dorcoceras hygrometricum]|uniref:Dystroglycan-like n=1 Tax=Dorcoceras hygrometricum TaxID=472368 RepID=A0A2Z7AH57_9LAMI|nr:hypothetical protein F511_13199 [Dorcoceras hygrometricum]
MASSFYSNAQHVDFESVLGMDDHGMVSMFEALMASGLRGFLGCPAVVHEDALVDFFENASVRSGVIISTVGGQLVEISEERFAESFELPVDAFGDLSKIPKDAIFYARSIVSLSGRPGTGPNPNPRRNQTSRHDIAGDSPERRPAGGGRHHRNRTTRGYASCRVSMTFRVVRTNQYNQDLGLIHSTNGNHLESPKEGSSIDHQVTINLHAQNITMFPTNETWYFASQILVSNSGGLILILTAQSTRNVFRIHSDY